MYKSAIKKLNWANNNQFVDCLTQSVNPVVFIEILEATLSYVKSPNRTDEHLSISFQVYFTHPLPFVRILRDELSFSRTFAGNIALSLFTGSQWILPNPLGIQVRVNNLLADETVDFVIIYNEQIQKSIDELAAEYL
jgi:hypothetical protein